MPGLIACPECDIVVNIPALADGQRAACPRCQHVLISRSRDGFSRSLALASGAAVFLIIANVYPFLSLKMGGITNAMTLAETTFALYREGLVVVATMVMGFTIVMPAVLLAGIICLLLLLTTTHPPALARVVGKALFMLAPWSMVEVFVIGVIVSFVKLSSMATVELGVGFWAYSAFAVCFVGAVSNLDRFSVWNAIEQLPPMTADIEGTAAISGLANCHTCMKLSPVSQGLCSRCGDHLHLRIPGSLQRTTALLLTAAILYIPANIYPIMVTDQFGSSTPSTILGGVILLWHLGSYPVAAIIFVASVLVPLGKLLSLSVLVWTASRGDVGRPRDHTMLYRITEFVGRWSMIDVFVVAILVALIQLGGILVIRPGIAALAFTGVVIITMLAAESFDPRLIWDRVRANGVRDRDGY